MQEYAGYLCALFPSVIQKWQKIKTDQHICILIKLGTELPSRAGWMTDILRYLILPPKWTDLWLPINEDRILLSLTHSVFLCVMDTPFSCRACVSLLLVSFHSDIYGQHLAPVALAHVPCVLAENTSLHSMDLMSRLKLVSVQHFFPQHWCWEVPSSVGASREKHGQGSKPDADTCWHVVQPN